MTHQMPNNLFNMYILDLHQPTKRRWAPHSGKSSPPWSQACPLQVGLDMDVCVQKEVANERMIMGLGSSLICQGPELLLGNGMGVFNWESLSFRLSYSLEPHA